MHPTPEQLAPAASPERRHWGVTLLWLAPALFLLAFVVYGVLTRPPAVLEHAVAMAPDGIYHFPERHGVRRTS